MAASKRLRDGKESTANREIVKRPGKDDVHEQREHNQHAEGVIRRPSPEPQESGRGHRSPEGKD